MLLTTLLLCIPCYLAFRRGHDGLKVAAIAVVCFIPCHAIGWLWSEAVGVAGMIITTLALSLAMLGERGPRGDQLAAVDQLNAPGDDEPMAPAVDISDDDDWVPIFSTAGELQQHAFDQVLAAMAAADVDTKVIAGSVGCVMVRLHEANRAQAALPAHLA